MPRRRRRAPQAGDQGGYGAQPLAAPRDQPYGERKAQIDAQRVIPLASVEQPVNGRSNGQSGGQVTPVDRQARIAAAIDAARRLRPPQPLTGPSRRPTEPLTAGLGMGPGPGPEVLRTGDRTLRTLRLLAETTGDPMFAQLAEQAALRGR